MVTVAGPNFSCSRVTCGAVAAAIVAAASRGGGVSWATMGPGTLTSQVRRTPTARAAPLPRLWRLHGPCEIALLVHERGVPPCTSVRAWGQPAARPLRRCSSGVQGGTRLMESDSWLDQCASRDLIGFSFLYQRVSLAQDPALLLGRDGVSSERACGAALPTQMAGDGVQHGRETPREQASWSCVSSCYTEVSRHLFPGGAPILQWGIKKDE